MNREQAYAQGARCGHIEGKDAIKGRETPVSTYPRERDEIWEAAQVAAQNQGYSPFLTREWAAGYEHGYRYALKGEKLEQAYVDG